MEIIDREHMTSVIVTSSPFHSPLSRTCTDMCVNSFVHMNIISLFQIWIVLQQKHWVVSARSPFINRAPIWRKTSKTRWKEQQRTKYGFTRQHRPWGDFMTVPRILNTAKHCGGLCGRLQVARHLTFQCYSACLTGFILEGVMKSASHTSLQPRCAGRIGSGLVAWTL